MKKLIFAFCGAALLLASCGDKKAPLTEAQQANKEFGDSLAVAFGNFAGAKENETTARMLAQLPEADRDKYSKDEFVRGLELVLKADTANIAFLNGIYSGLQMYNPIMQAERGADVPVDIDLLIESFKATYMADSTADVNAYMMAYSTLSQQMYDKAQEKRVREIEQSEEAQKNLADGKAYAQKALDEDGFQQSESGLVYKIKDAGTGENVKPTDDIVITYVGKHIDGSVFDQSGEEGYTSRASRFIPGFTEGLQLLGKGGSATLIIPANLAYGVEGQGSNIGRNETLVFDITIKDIK